MAEPPPAFATGPSVGEPLPAFTLPDQRGEPVNPLEARGGDRALVVFVRGTGW